MTSTHVGRNRLLKLADYLETIPHAELQMNRWLGRRGINETGDRITKQDLEEANVANKLGDVRHLTSECGFAACAVVHACAIPSFKRAGLKLMADSEGVGVVYQEDHDVHAVASFFGISYYGADDLFGYNAYAPRVRPTTVANRIRNYVKEYM